MMRDSRDVAKKGIGFCVFGLVFLLNACLIDRGPLPIRPDPSNDTGIDAFSSDRALHPDLSPNDVVDVIPKSDAFSGDGEGEDAPSGDTSVDDASIDASPDTAPSVYVDAGLDAGIDAGQDAGIADARTDTGQDAGTDAGQDAGTDAGQDAGTDAGQDARIDASQDARHS
ncbi:MAG: hypothetical protein NZM37_00345 [Sandaracinaceae bacterium]|nr:hypothetical protein [Sandaracinaceae bacterium]MDW8245242.1 hypothetical protein [Sandaracinaceae bacterium]